MSSADLGMLKQALEAKRICHNQVMEAVHRRQVTLDNPGFCLSCGAEATSVEPDARRYACDTCGEKSVFGAEELLLMMM